LTQEFAGPIKCRDTAVSVAISDIDIAVARINSDVGRHKELAMAGVKCSSFERAVRGIDRAAFTDLQ
jgi:hypothetical protein